MGGRSAGRSPRRSTTRPHRRRDRRPRRSTPRLVALLHAPGRPPAPREVDAVLAQPLRHEPRQGPGPGPHVPPERLLRAHALGKFGPLLQAISRDPAMLVWLDSNSNVKGKPNENYARELMELFSLGVGNYTEKDVREAAPAFTGWRTDGEQLRASTPAFTTTRPRRSWARPAPGMAATWSESSSSSRRRRDSWSASSTGPLSENCRRRPTRCSSRSANPSEARLRHRRAVRHHPGLPACLLAHAFRQRIKGPLEYVRGRPGGPPGLRADEDYRRCRSRSWSPGSRRWASPCSPAKRQGMAGGRPG